MVGGYTGTIYFNKAKTSYYKGKWKADAKHGQGEIIYGSGNTYVGQWADNLKQGAGTMEWKVSQPALSQCIRYATLHTQPYGP